MNTYLEQTLAPTLARFIQNCISTELIYSIKRDEKIDVESIYGYSNLMTMYHDGILLSLNEGGIELQYVECNNTYCATSDNLPYYLLVEERWDGYESEFAYCTKDDGMYDFKNISFMHYLSTAAENSHNYIKEYCSRINTHEMTYYPICGIRRD